MKRLLSWSASLLLYLLLCSGNVAAQSGAFASMQRAVLLDATQQSSEKKSVNDILRTLRPNGSFSDHPEPDEFILGSRILTLAKAYHNDPQWRGNNSLKEDIYSALLYWFENEKIRTSTSGWTARGLRYPRNAGFVANLMKEAISRDRSGNNVAQQLHDHILSVYSEVFLNINGRPGNILGPNLSSRLRGGMYLAVYAENAAWMREIKQKATETFELGAGTQTQAKGYPHVGLTPDFSFHHHNNDGGQNIWNNYGIVWLDEIGKYIEIVKESPYDLEAGEYDILYRAITEGLRYYNYHTEKNYMVCGRFSLQPNLGSGVGSFVLDRIVKAVPTGVYTARQMDLLRQLEQEFRREALAPSLNGSKYFYTSDMLVHSRLDHYLSVKMLSNRSASLEMGLGYSVMNYHMGDGAYLLYKDGKEYKNARAAWNVTAVPGVTAEQKSGMPSVAKTGHTDSRNSFAGGLSDTRNTVAGFYLDKDQPYSTINAQKGYFLFDNIFGFLGSNINQNAGTPKGETWTTLDQRELRGPVTYFDGNQVRTINPGNNTQRTLSGVRNPVWFHHDGFGYIVVPRKAIDVMLWAEVRQGGWRRVDQAIRSNNTFDVSIFQVSLNHGQKPAQAGYQYFIVPNVTASQMSNLTSNMRLEILRNDNNAMGVYHKEQDILQGIFYKAGESLTSPLGLTVTADKEAVVMVKDEANGIKLSVSDPNQSEDKLTMTFNERFSGPGAVWDATKEVTVVTIDLPRGVYKGNQVDLTLSRGNTRPTKEAPVAKFTFTLSNNQLAPSELSADASGSSDPDGTISKYDWDFGDGSAGQGVTVKHIYSQPGTYTLSLTVTDNDGLTKTLVENIVIGKQVTAPEASFEYILTSTTVPATVGVDGQNSTDPDGTIQAYAWDFGNGKTASGPTASYTYQTAGRYTITLTVTDNDGLTHSTARQINLKEAPAPAPTPNPTPSPTPSPAPSTCDLSGGWESMDLGDVRTAGTACEDLGVFTITASGNYVGRRADQGHFVYRRMTGDVDIRVQVMSLDNSDPDGVAGLMIRGSLNANAENASILLSPEAKYRLWFPRRNRQGLNTNTSRHRKNYIDLPYWVRIQRRGNTVVTYYSADGNKWEKYKGGVVNFSTDDLYVGMVVNSYTGDAKTATAVFDNLTVNGKSATGGGDNTMLSDFKALFRPGQGSVELLWTTSSESGLSHFEVERSTDGQLFQRLETVKANGNSSLPSSYAAMDEKPFQGKAYYRLRVVDEKGSETFSDIVILDLTDGPQPNMTIFPNPATYGERIEIEGFIPDAKGILIQIVNQEGKVVWRKYEKTSTGGIRKRFPTSVLTPGKYVISLTDQGQSNTYLYENFILRQR